MTETKVDRFVRLYEKTHEGFLVDELKLRVSSSLLQTLQELFDKEENDSMYDCYPIMTIEQQNYFKDNYEYPFDFDYYDYFLEADAAN